MNPRALYSQLLQQRRDEMEEREKRHRALGYVRLAVAAAALAIVWAALATERLSIVWVIVPVAVFAVLVVAGDRLLRDLERRRRAAAYFERGLARLDGKWAGTGETGDSYADPSHPYAQDLDLFGKGSLFELLCTARTHVGDGHAGAVAAGPRRPGGGAEPARKRSKSCARAWTCAKTWRWSRRKPAPAWTRSRSRPGAKRRRCWNREVCGRCSGASRCSDPADLSRCGSGWATWAACSNSRMPRPLLARDLFLLALVVNGLFLYLRREPLAFVVAAVEAAAHELGLMSEVLVRLEREQFH